MLSIFCISSIKYFFNFNSCSWILLTPILFMYKIASFKPITSAIGGVPASNLVGMLFNSYVPSSSKYWFIPPPYCTGSIFSNKLYLPYKTPTPVGPIILWAEKAINDILHFSTLTSIWLTACEASTIKYIFLSSQILPISSIGRISPTTLLT